MKEDEHGFEFEVKIPETWILWGVLGLLALMCLVGCEVRVQEPGHQVIRPIAPQWSAPCQPAPGPKCGPDKCCQALAGYLVPYCDIPEPWRERNYAGGSCVHASLETVLHWQGQHALAKWWRETYAYGEYPDRLHSRMEAARLKFAAVQSRGSEGITFLERCCELRLCAAVNLPTGHMQTLVGLDSQFAYVIDNNGAGQIDRWPRDEFFQTWTGWAVTVVGNPPPPEPYL